MSIDYIIQVKKDSGMTTDELSRKSGIPLGTLNKILAGQTSDPKFETVKAMCSALGIRLSELDDFESEQSELTEYMDELHKRPELKILFKAAKNASKTDIEKAVKIIEMFANDQDE